jgi:hypothetical protein
MIPSRPVTAPSDIARRRAQQERRSCVLPLGAAPHVRAPALMQLDFDQPAAVNALAMARMNIAAQQESPWYAKALADREVHLATAQARQVQRLLEQREVRRALEAQIEERRERAAQEQAAAADEIARQREAESQERTVTRQLAATRQRRLESAVACKTENFSELRQRKRREALEQQAARDELAASLRAAQEEAARIAREQFDERRRVVLDGAADRARKREVQKLEQEATVALERRLLEERLRREDEEDRRRSAEDQRRRELAETRAAMAATQPSARDAMLTGRSEREAMSITQAMEQAAAAKQRNRIMAKNELRTVLEDQMLAKRHADGGQLRAQRLYEEQLCEDDARRALEYRRAERSRREEMNAVHRRALDQQIIDTTKRRLIASRS